MHRRSMDAPACLRNLHLLGRLPGGLRLFSFMARRYGGAGGTSIS